MITLARGRWDGTKLVDVKDIFSAVANGNASRILFARDGTLIMSVGYGDPRGASELRESLAVILCQARKY